MHEETFVSDIKVIDSFGKVLVDYSFSTYAKFSEKLKFLNPGYARGFRMLVFRKILRAY